MSRTASLCAICALALFAVSNVGLALASDPIEHFAVFDGLLYTGKPDLTSFGMRRIIQVNQPSAANFANYQFDDAGTRASLKSLAGFTGTLFLDYEIWPLDDISAQKVSDHVQAFVQVARVTHQVVPAAKIGFYGLMPCREYWGLVKRDPIKVNKWKECNREGEAIASHVDVIFPSLYTFYNDQESWDLYAKGMIEEARRYRKPVYVFLWPEFHVSNVFLRGTNIPAKFWRHQLEFCRGLADGIVIWGGWQEQWREDAPWWIETKAFLAALRAS